MSNLTKNVDRIWFCLCVILFYANTIPKQGARHFLQRSRRQAPTLHGREAQGELELPCPPFHQPKGLVAKARLWLPFDVETELASVSNVAKKDSVGE
jgi:hypothetical protein